MFALSSWQPCAPGDGGARGLAGCSPPQPGRSGQEWEVTARTDAGRGNRTHERAAPAPAQGSGEEEGLHRANGAPRLPITGNLDVAPVATAAGAWGTPPNLNSELTCRFSVLAYEARFVEPRRAPHSILNSTQTGQWSDTCFSSNAWSTPHVTKRLAMSGVTTIRSYAQAFAAMLVSASSGTSQA